MLLAPALTLLATLAAELWIVLETSTIALEMPSLEAAAMAQMSSMSMDRHHQAIITAHHLLDTTMVPPLDLMYIDHTAHKGEHGL
jgi:hypothetical protein